ncbi:MAG: haloacid dehalogenase type II [Vicinamibacterales bacterium]
MGAYTRRRVVASMMAAAGVSGLVRPAAGGQDRGRQGRRRILVFDVNETLLDVGALGPLFARAFGDARVGQDWFSNVVLYSQVAALAGPYAEFGAIARSALDMTAAARGVTLAAADRDAVLRGLVTLPAHPDVRDGLDMLRQAGFRLVTLTNSAPAAVEQQLTSAGLADYFERSFSVDAVRTFKPAPEVYRQVAADLGVEIGSLRLIAAHAWDVMGAMQAGTAAAFIARPGKALFPLAPVPDVVGRDLREVAGRIIAIDAA